MFEKTDHIKKEFIEFVETKKKIIKQNIKNDESQKVIKKKAMNCHQVPLSILDIHK